MAVLVLWLVFLVLLAIGETLLHLRRPGESRLHLTSSVLAFPASATILLYLFPGRPEVAGAAWAILAAGDGSASLARAVFPSRSLPWNREKSWSGGIAFIAAGWPAGILAWLYLAAESTPAAAASVLLLPVLAAAAAESVPARFSDNVPVAMVAGLLLGVSFAAPGVVTSPPMLALGSVVAFAAAGILSGAVDRRGALIGGAGSALVAFAFGWGGLVPVYLFVALGSAATRGCRRRRAGRSSRHVFANLGAAFFAALLVLRGGDPGVLALFFAGALATALSDTLSSEIGMLSRTPPRLLLTWKAVPPGADGAVTPLGTAAGVLGAAAIAFAGHLAGLYPPAGALAVLLGGVAGNLVDSLLGATFERSGRIGNEEVNFLATLAGAVLAAAVGLAAGT